MDGYIELPSYFKTLIQKKLVLMFTKGTKEDSSNIAQQQGIIKKKY